VRPQKGKSRTLLASHQSARITYSDALPERGHWPGTRRPQKRARSPADGENEDETDDGDDDDEEGEDEGEIDALYIQ